MSHTASYQLHLQHILDAIRGIQDTTAGLRFDTFSSVWSVRRSTERGLEIISEASRRLRESLKNAHPYIPWRDIAGIGNVLRHDYDDVSDHVVWDIVGSHLDSLETAVRAMLAGAAVEPDSLKLE